MWITTALRPRKINGQRIGTDFSQEEILANMPVEKHFAPNQRNEGQKSNEKPFYGYQINISKPKLILP